MLRLWVILFAVLMAGCAGTSPGKQSAQGSVPTASKAALAAHPAPKRGANARSDKQGAPRIEHKNLEPVSVERAEGDAGFPDAEIAAILVRMSIEGYYGTYPCPHSRDNGGRKCGARSEWSKPGGNVPLCSEADVTPEMISLYRENQKARSVGALR